MGRRKNGIAHHGSRASNSDGQRLLFYKVESAASRSRHVEKCHPGSHHKSIEELKADKVVGCHAPCHRGGRRGCYDIGRGLGCGMEDLGESDFWIIN